MEMPPSLPNIDLGAAGDTAANDMRSAENTKRSPKSKYLDDYDTYTADGYMAPKHVYADVKDIPPRAQCQPVPDHYDIVKPASDNFPPSSSAQNLYEDPRAMKLDSTVNPTYGNIPADDMKVFHYDVPRLSAASADVASEYSSAADLREQAKTTRDQYDIPSNRSSPSNNETADIPAADLYDHPRNLKDFESKETCA